ncbi:MAG: UDP-glucose 4-epimerase GalE [Moorea sp. SIO2I5]|nr:UDP-glucose 4-epimerase GalE [Moorena sp. SIO2I5]
MTNSSFTEYEYLLKKTTTSNKTVLVTGGAGYIGSHVVRQLGEAGYRIVVYDNFSTGSPESVLYGKLIKGDLRDINHLQQVFAQHNFSTVFHFAASLIVPESIQRPLDYYVNNIQGTLNLLRCCDIFGIEKFIFSSTAAVYGNPQINPVTEDALTKPMNPYGCSKLASEWIIQDYARAYPLKYVILRYFNVAGSDPQGRIKPQAKKVKNLISLVCDTALGRRPYIEIFGCDYPTPDGTAIRDFIHVEDLASAHLSALHYLEQGYDSQIFNCGYGQGYSVQEVCSRVQEISGVNFPIVMANRRPGDPAQVVACVDKVRKTLNWQFKHNCLDSIIRSTLASQAKLVPQPTLTAQFG